LSEIETIEITAPTGARARVLTYGARLQSLTAPDRHGAFDTIVLGFPDPEAYRRDTAFIGGVIGRYANRIADGHFSLDGREVVLLANDGANHLHGGPGGFDKRDWRIAGADSRSVTLTLVSEDGDQGYPGCLSVSARYAFESDGALSIDLTATTDASTIVNLTHHAYFNLAGQRRGGSIGDHWLRLAADRFTPVDAAAIPTGEIRGATGTPFDFASPHRIGERWAADDPQIAMMAGYDHNMVLVPSAGAVRLVATLFDPPSGRVLDLMTGAPGLQFYSGNALASPDIGFHGSRYAAREGLCLEPQFFPDSPNRPGFPSAGLDPDIVYHQEIRLRFRTARDLNEAFES